MARLRSFKRTGSSPTGFTVHFKKRKWLKYFGLNF
jgi:hypothetical protein